MRRETGLALPRSVDCLCVPLHRLSNFLCRPRSDAFGDSRNAMALQCQLFDCMVDPGLIAIDGHLARRLNSMHLSSLRGRSSLATICTKHGGGSDFFCFLPCYSFLSLLTSLPTWRDYWGKPDASRRCRSDPACRRLAQRPRACPLSSRTRSRLSRTAVRDLLFYPLSRFTPSNLPEPLISSGSASA